MIRGVEDLLADLRRIQGTLLDGPAIEEFRIAIQLDPAYADAYNNLGVAYGNKGMTDAAIEQFRKAIELNPGSAEAHNNLGFAYGKAGKVDEGIEEYKTAISLQPAYAEAYNNLGIAYGELGRVQEEADAYRRTIRLDPENTIVMNQSLVFRQNRNIQMDFIAFHQTQPVNFSDGYPTVFHLSPGTDSVTVIVNSSVHIFQRKNIAAFPH